MPPSKRTRDPAEDSLAEDPSWEQQQLLLQREPRDGSCNAPFTVPFTYVVQRSFTLNQSETVVAPALPSWSIGDSALIVFNPTIAATYLYVAAAVKANSVMETGSGNGLLTPGVLGGKFTFAVDTYVPMGDQPVVSSVVTEVAIGSGLPISNVPTFDSAELQSAKIRVQGTSASTTSMALVGFIATGTPGVIPVYLSQNPLVTRIPSYLKAASASKINVLTVPLQEGVELRVPRSHTGQILAGSVPYFQSFGGDAYRIGLPQGGATSTNKTANPDGSYDLFISPFGTFTPPVGSPACFNFTNPGLAVSPGMCPEIELTFAAVRDTLQTSGGIGGCVQLTYYFAYVSETGLSSTLSTQTCHPIFVPSTTLVEIGGSEMPVDGGTVICSFRDHPYLAHVGTCAGNQTVWIGTGVRMADNTDANPTNSPYYLARLGVHVPGAYTQNRNLPPYVAYVNCTSPQQQVTVSGTIDIRGVPSSVTATYANGSARPEDNVLFVSPQ